jgi:hypothetical protein
VNKDARLTLLRAYYREFGLDLSWREVETLQRTAQRYQTLALHLCNGVIQQDAYDKASAAAWEKLKTILVGKISPQDIETHGDPRGFCLQITTPNKRLIAPERFN